MFDQDLSLLWFSRKARSSTRFRLALPQGGALSLRRPAAARVAESLLSFTLSQDIFEEVTSSFIWKRWLTNFRRATALRCARQTWTGVRVGISRSRRSSLSCRVSLRTDWWTSGLEDLRAARGRELVGVQRRGPDLCGCVVNSVGDCRVSTSGRSSELRRPMCCCCTLWPWPRQ